MQPDISSQTHTYTNTHTHTQRKHWIILTYWWDWMFNFNSIIKYTFIMFLVPLYFCVLLWLCIRQCTVCVWVCVNIQLNLTFRIFTQKNANQSIHPDTDYLNSSIIHSLSVIIPLYWMVNISCCMLISRKRSSVLKFIRQ